MCLILQQTPLCTYGNTYISNYYITYYVHLISYYQVQITIRFKYNFYSFVLNRYVFTPFAVYFGVKEERNLKTYTNHPLFDKEYLQNKNPSKGTICVRFYLLLLDECRVNKLLLLVCPPELLLISELIYSKYVLKISEIITTGHNLDTCVST